MRIRPMLLPALLLLLATPTSAAAPEPLAPGTPLPSVEGETLSGARLELPAAARGRVTLVAMGFSYASRHAVEPWMDRFRREFAGDSAVTTYELPMMSGVGPRLGKPFITSGMRKGTPVALHANVATVWTDVGAWRKRLGVRDPDLAYLILLDREGRVAWSGTGAPDLGGFDALVTRVRELVAR